MPLEQRPALAFGHAAPDTELDLVVERVGEALDDHGTPPADHRRFPLRRATDEKLIGIGGATSRSRHPCGSAFFRRTGQQRHADIFGAHGAAEVRSRLLDFASR